MNRTDVLIIGGGIVGLATAYRLLQERPGLDLTLLEKESSLAQHQTGRNSGVLHSGIYYEPGSLKATNCRAGKAAMVEFCRREGIDFDLCGKVIVATDESELPALEKIYERGQQNGVECELIDANRLQDIEPHVKGVRAIHVPETGIVDYQVVCERLAARVREMGGQIETDAQVTRLISLNGSTSVYVESGDPYTARAVVNCAGLHSDRIAKMSGAEIDVRIVPFRGEYYRLVPEAQPFCQGLIYPVPNRDFPFLGVHFTRRIDGGVECGPNAVLAFAREGYTHGDVDLRDLADTLTYPGFLKLAASYWKTGIGEMWRSVHKPAFVSALQKLVPAVRPEHLEWAPAGVRAQAVTTDGDLLDDFMIDETGNVVNVCNAPSPAATSALSIGQSIANRLLPAVTVSA